MALRAIPPLSARVRWDRRRGRPGLVAWANGWVTVQRLAAVRDQRAAYPAAAGPRVTFVVDTDAGQAALVYDQQHRRWTVEALDEAA